MFFNRCRIHNNLQLDNIYLLHHIEVLQASSNIRELDKRGKTHFFALQFYVFLGFILLSLAVDRSQ